MRVGLSGHQEMPDVAWDFASTSIDDYITDHGELTGICSLAVGSDQLFADKIVASGNELYVVIPCKNYEATFDEAGLGEYKTLLEAAANTETLDFTEPSEEAFFAAGKRVAELSDELIAVWDGEAAQGLGGTADIVKYAKALGKTVLLVWPEGATR
jgi:hypothetical protein